MTTPFNKEEFGKLFEKVLLDMVFADRQCHCKTCETGYCYDEVRHLIVKAFLLGFKRNLGAGTKKGEA